MCEHRTLIDGCYFLCWERGFPNSSREHSFHRIALHIKHYGKSENLCLHQKLTDASVIFLWVIPLMAKCQQGAYALNTQVAVCLFLIVFSGEKNKLIGWKYQWISWKEGCCLPMWAIFCKLAGDGLVPTGVPLSEGVFNGLLWYWSASELD